MRPIPAGDDASDRGHERPAILFVLPWLPNGIGGVDRVVLDLMAGFAEHSDYRPLLLANGPQRRVVRRTRDGLPPFFEFLLRPPFDERRVARSLLTYLIRLPVTLARFIALIRREKIATVNLHYPSLSAFTVLLARYATFGAFNVALSFHGSDVPRGDCSALARLTWRFVLRRADANVVCSQALANELRDFNPGLGSAICVVHNAIDSDTCRRAARQAPLPQGLEAHPYLLSVGKFEEKKAHDVLIESYERIAARHADLRLVIIGLRGPTLDACRERVAASPFRERVLLYCDVPHDSTLAAIARARLFTLPSRREPFGLVILEAAVLTVPIVASRVGGIPEIIRDGHSGILVPPDDATALADALECLLNDPERAGEQARRLREVVRTNFGLAAQTLAYRELFETLPNATRVDLAECSPAAEAASRQKLEDARWSG